CLRGRRAVVLLVGDVFTPGGRTARLIDLLNREVGHEAIGSGTVPMLLPGLEAHAIAGPDLLDRATPVLAAPDALDHVDGLAARVGVPRGAGTGSEVDARRGDARRIRRRRHLVEVHGAGE